MKEYTIRPIQRQEIPLLEECLYQAIFQRQGEALLPRDSETGSSSLLYATATLLSAIPMICFCCFRSGKG